MSVVGWGDRGSKGMGADKGVGRINTEDISCNKKKGRNRKVIATQNSEIIIGIARQKM
jgi:hypothetical protein